MRWPFYFSMMLIFLAGPAFSATESPFDNMIPSNVLMYWGSNQQADLTDDFPNYQKASENWSDLMNDILEWRVLKSEFNATIDKSGVVEGISALSGEKSCFALYPLIDGTPIPGLCLYVADVEDPKKAQKVLDTICEEIDALLPSVRSIKDEYYGYPMRSFYSSIMLPGLDLAYTFKDSTLLLSNSKALLLRTIDLWEDEQGFLTEMENYQQAIAGLPDQRSSTFFANIKEAGNTSNSLLKNLQTLRNFDIAEKLNDSMPLIETAFGLLNMFQSYASTQSVDSQGRLINSSITRLNLNLDSDAAQAMIDRPAVPFEFERYLPRKVGTVNSGNILGPKDLWNLLHTGLEDFPPAKTLIDSLHAWEEESGVSIEEDIFSWMGDSWCIMRPVMDLETVIATNQGAILLSVTDKQAAEKGIAKLFDLIKETFDLPLVTDSEPYLDTQITTLSLPIPLIPIEPSWCIQGNTLILSTRPNMIREMLDIASGVRSGIERNRQYKFLQDALLKPANKVTFQDNESEFYAFREAIRKVAQIPEFDFGLPRELHTVPGFFLDRAAYLMSCWQTLRGTVKRSVIDNGRIVTEKTLLYKDLRSVPLTDSILQRQISLGAKDLVAGWAAYSQQQGNLERALRLYTHLVEFFPNEGTYLSQLGDLYKKEGKQDEALAVYNRIIEKNPETAYLIARERLFDNSNTDEIIQRIQKMTSQSLRIREDAALFGIALAKRDAGDTETANGLFQYVSQSPKSSKNIATSAANESVLIQGKQVENIIHIAFTPNPPEIDGKMDETIWNQAGPVTMGDGESQSPPRIRFLRDESNLYLLMTSPKTGKEENIKLLVCPTRDYTHIDQITIDKKSESSLARRVIDPFKISLHSEKSFQFGQLIPSNIPNIVQIIEKAIKTGEVNESGFNVFQKPEESFPAKWKEQSNGDSETQCLEAAIPWKLLQIGRVDNKPVWLMNVIWTIERDEDALHQSLSGGEEPFEYRYARIR